MRYEKLIELVDNPNSFGNQRPTLPIEVNYTIAFLQSSRSISSIAFEGTSISNIQRDYPSIEVLDDRDDNNMIYASTSNTRKKGRTDTRYR